jgi:hypothetical protein
LEIGKYDYRSWGVTWAERWWIATRQVLHELLLLPFEFLRVNVSVREIGHQEPEIRRGKQLKMERLRSSLRAED